MKIDINQMNLSVLITCTYTVIATWNMKERDAHVIFLVICQTYAACISVLFLCIRVQQTLHICVVHNVLFLLL